MEPPMKKAKTAKPVFVVTAGASGCLPGERKTGEIVKPEKSPRTHLAKHGAVVGPIKSANGKSMAGGGGCTPATLMAHRTALQAIYSEDEHRPIFLAGQSFGSRLSVHSHAGIWGKRSKDLTTINHKIGEGPTNDDGAIWKGLDGLGLPPTLAGMICFGYPANHAVQDRIEPLRKLPKGTNVLFVTGSEDEGGKVAALVEEALPQLACSSTAEHFIVQGGKHNPFDNKRKKDEAASHVAIEAKIAGFVEKCLADGTNGAGAEDGTGAADAADAAGAAGSDGSGGGGAANASAEDA